MRGVSRPGSAVPRGGAPQLSRPASAVSLAGAKGVASWQQRPSSAVPGWPGAPPGAGVGSGQRPWRPGSAAATRTKQPLFSPAFTKGAGPLTRGNKDWQVAGNLVQRGQRADVLSLRRLSASTGSLPLAQEGDALAPPCPLARGPLGARLKTDVRPSSAHWHKKKVRQIYKVMDPQRDGAVRMEQLRDSFEVLSMPIDDQTFERYAEDLLPSSSVSDPNSSVLASEFAAFHKEVWASQPGVVRWHAGDPADSGVSRTDISAIDLDISVQSTMSVAETVMNRSTAAPSEVAMGELRSNEQMLRKSFVKHAEGNSALLNFDRVPAILQDLGLPRDLPDILATTDLDASAANFNDELSFHQTVDLVNKCIATHEATRTSAPMTYEVGKTCERLGAALRYSFAMGDEEASSSDEEAGMKERAAEALEAALFGDDDGMSSWELHSIALQQRAQEALEAALLGTHLTPRSMAVAAIESALLGEDYDDDEENDDPAAGMKRRASQALEAALLGDMEVVEEDVDPAAGMKRRASQALEAALLGEEFGGSDGEEAEPQSLDATTATKRRASAALEAALFGVDGYDEAAETRDEDE